MTYATNTIVSATPALDLMNSVEALMTQQGWQFVEEYVVSGTSPSGDVARVWRCPGLNNSIALDFIITMRRTSYTSPIYFTLSEGWNSTARALVNWTPVYNIINVAPMIDGRMGTGGSVSAGTVNSGTNGTAYIGDRTLDHAQVERYSVGLNTTGFQWWVSITNDRLVVCTRNGTTDNAVYMGTYDSFHPSNITPYPITISYLRTAGSATADRQIGSNEGRVTRETVWPEFRDLANFSTTDTRYYYYGVWNGIGFTTGPDQGSSYREGFSQRLIPHRMVMRTSGRRNGLIGMWRPDVLYLDLSRYVAPVINGDTITIDGSLWTRLGHDGSWWWVNQSA